MVRRHIAWCSSAHHCCFAHGLLPELRQRTSSASLRTTTQNIVHSCRLCMQSLGVDIMTLLFSNAMTAQSSSIMRCTQSSADRSLRECREPTHVLHLILRAALSLSLIKGRVASQAPLSSCQPRQPVLVNHRRQFSSKKLFLDNVKAHRRTIFPLALLEAASWLKAPLTR